MNRGFFVDCPSRRITPRPRHSQLFQERQQTTVVYTNHQIPPVVNMGREEQIEEREVLDSIFPDEITG